MSHWMTSGSARLKAKKNNSFSRRAQQRAAIVAPEAMRMENAVPAADRRYRTQTRRNEAKRRYSSGNPIARRGIVVSATNDHYYDNGNAAETDKTTAEKRFIDDSPINPRGVSKRRRVRDARSRYRDLYSNQRRTQYQDTRRDHDSTYNPYFTSDVCQFSNGPYHQQEEPLIQVTSPNNRVHAESLWKVPIQFSMPVSSNQAGFIDPTVGNPPLSAGFYPLYDIHQNSQTHNGLERQHISVNSDHIVPHYPGQVLISQETKPIPKGIGRFQKQEDDLQDFILDIEGSEDDYVMEMNDEASWEYMNDEGLEHIPASDPTKIDTEIYVKGNSDAFVPPPDYEMEFRKHTEHRPSGSWNEQHAGASFYQEGLQRFASKSQSNITISGISLASRMSDITTNSNVFGGTPSQSEPANGAIKMFRDAYQQESSIENSHENPSLGHLQPNKPILNDDIHSLGGLKFFDNDNEVDAFGNLGNVSPSIQTGLSSIFQFGTPITEKSPLIPTRHYRDDGCDEPKLQTIALSPDTEFLSSVPFRDESVWNFFR